MSSQLIGRDREIGRLFECLDEVLGGCARLIMCVGEPGIGREPTEAELRAVFDATSGNPYFVTELARQLADGGGFRNPVPAGVLEAIGQRLAQLSHACVATLGTAAVLGTCSTSACWPR
jgi:hypothetical protein